MTYRLNEFQFQLPDSELLDASINILKFPELGTSLIISRSQLQELRYQPRQDIRLGADQSLDAIESHSQYSKGADKVYQFQLAFVLPGTRKMTALSYVKAQPLGDAEAAHWATIKHSLALV